MTKKPAAAGRERKLRIYVGPDFVDNLEAWGQAHVYSKRNGYKSRAPAILILRPKKERKS